MAQENNHSSVTHTHLKQPSGAQNGDALLLGGLELVFLDQGPLPLLLPPHLCIGRAEHIKSCRDDLPNL